MYTGEIIVKTLEFKWEIKHFCITCKNFGEALKSSPFETISEKKTMKWQLLLFPKGQNMENKDCLSIYLRNLNTAVEVIANFFILNSKQEKVVGTKFNSASKIDQNKLCGCKKFVEHSFVIDKTNDVLINNTLTILCEISLRSNFIDVNDSNLCSKKRKIEEECACKLSVDLEKLFESGKFTDITFIVNGEEIPVHKNILASRSSVFDAMFQSDMKEKEENKVVIKDIKYAVLMELFRYIYTEEVHKINEVASDLLIAADKYCVEGLKLKCEKVLCDNITSNNVLEYLELADVFSAPKLRFEAIKFITTNSKDIVDKPDFKTFADLHSNVMCEIFRAMADNK